MFERNNVPSEMAPSIQWPIPYDYRKKLGQFNEATQEEFDLSLKDMKSCSLHKYNIIE